MFDRIILLAAAGEFLTDTECQRSALNIITNCVCGPITKINKKKGRPIEDISKLWRSVRFNNGIMVLINLLHIKSPITDADLIRGLACKALCGLSRCENIKQLICKLPLFEESQLQSKKFYLKFLFKNYFLFYFLSRFNERTDITG